MTYYITGIETTYETFTNRDWDMLRNVWGDYHKKLDQEYAGKE